MSDVRFAVRSLLKSRGFTAVALLTIALGIGANTAVFSVVNGVLLNPLPFPKPDQLVTFYENRPNFPKGSLSYMNFLDWKSENHTFAAMAAYNNGNFVLTGAGQPEALRAQIITAYFFPILDVKPAIGRNFSPQEDRPGTTPVALISAGLWRRKFRSDKSVLGKAVTLDGRDYIIIGVVPANFHLRIQNFEDRDVYTLLGQSTNPSLFDRSAAMGIDGIGRLRPGVTVKQARTDLAEVMGNLSRAYPEANKGIGSTLIGLREEVVGDITFSLVMLLGAVALVLLIACVNVANLLLVRSSGRSREFGIRTALGATPWRVIQQLLAESMLLGITGGALGLLLARWLTDAALSFLPDTLPRSASIGIDAHVLVFTFLLSVGAGFLFGLTPALKAKSADLNEILREGGRGVSGTKRRAQQVFVVAELAVALVLLIGAGLMIRSLSMIWRVDPGFNPHHLLLSEITLSPTLRQGNPSEVRADLLQLNRAIIATPGVRSASLFDGAEPMQGDSEQLFWLGGQPRPAMQNLKWALNCDVMPEYFQTMGIPLKSGRFITADDNEHSRPVAVIDEVFAQTFFPNESAIGRTVNLDDKEGDEHVEIVGVVGHMKQWGLDTDSRQTLRSEIYRPLLQMRDKDIRCEEQGLALIVRSTGDPLKIVPSVTKTLLASHKEGVLEQPRSMDQVISETLAARQFFMLVLAVFAGLALLLAAIGLYGVIAYVVGQRTREFGIRVALGAQKQQVFQTVVADGLRMVSLGVALGIAGSFLLTTLLTEMLFEVKPADPLTFLTVGSGLILVALVACLLPARQAMRVDPITALRYE